ncbi:tail fiber assembly protein [Salmonella enterica subsp. enterica serovar Gloucester]|nr:tail fiber assembly protein [Salmonella enterica subsp. enterica serovar Gloucester]
MTYLYSATTNAFYPEALKQDYINTNSWPDDAKEVDDFIYNEYALEAVPEGKMRVPNDAGYPSWGDIPEPSQEELIASNTQVFNTLLRACTDSAFPLQSAVALGVATDEQKALLQQLQEYSVQLISTDLTVTPVQWPEKPASML